MVFLMRYSFRLLTMTWLVAAGPLQAQDLSVLVVSSTRALSRCGQEWRG